MTTSSPTVVDLARARKLRNRGLVLRSGSKLHNGDGATLAAVRAFPTPAADTHAPYDPRFAADVLAGLAQPEKSIPSTWLYDRRGSELFEQITQLHEYYPTRNEIGVLQPIEDIARLCRALGVPPDVTQVMVVAAATPVVRFPGIE